MALSRSPEADLRGRFFRLALPNVLANLLVPVAGLVDVALLGHLPELRHLAGVGLASVVFDYLFWTFGFLRMGTTGLVAQAAGAGEREEMDLACARALGLGLSIGALVLLASGPIERLAFAWLDGEPAVEAAGRAYFGGRILGAPFTLGGFALLGALLGQQRGGAVLAVSALLNASNIALDLLFIRGLGWESFGAGLATALSQGVAFVLAAKLVGLRRLVRSARQARARLFDRRRWRALWRLSGDLLVRTFALLSAFAIFTNASAAMGAVTLAANTLLLKALSTAAFFIDGYAFAAEGLAGWAAGRGDRRRLVALLRVALPTGLGTALLFAAAFAFAPQLFGLLSDHPPVLAEAARLSPYLALCLCCSGLAYVLDGYFLGLAAGPALRRAMLWSFGLAFLPLAMAARHLPGEQLSRLGVGMDRPELLWTAMIVFMAARALSLAVQVPASLARVGRDPGAGAGGEAHPER